MDVIVMCLHAKKYDEERAERRLLWVKSFWRFLTDKPAMKKKYICVIYLLKDNHINLIQFGWYRIQFHNTFIQNSNQYRQQPQPFFFLFSSTLFFHVSFNWFSLFFFTSFSFLANKNFSTSKIGSNEYHNVLNDYITIIVGPML